MWHRAIGTLGAAAALAFWAAFFFFLASALAWASADRGISGSALIVTEWAGTNKQER